MTKPKKYDEQQIKKLLKEKKLLLKKNSNVHSSVWKIFLQVFYEEQYTGYVLRSDCNQALKHDRATSGTSHLQRHIDRCPSKKKADHNQPGTSHSRPLTQATVTSFVSNLKPISTSCKEEIANAAVAFVAEDLRPFSAIEGKGLLKLANALINVGAKHGKVDAATVLSARNTIKRRADKLESANKKSIVEEVKQALVNNFIVGMTTDMWTDLKSRHFISLTVHYISKGTSTLKKHILTVHHYTDDKKTGENIRKTIQELCAIFDLILSVIAKTCYFVTDNTSNLKVAMCMPYGGNSFKSHFATKLNEQNC